MAVLRLFYSRKSAVLPIDKALPKFYTYCSCLKSAGTIAEIIKGVVES